ncbi:alpha/beta fold hydrolase [Nonomuraea sp. NPDC049784]|uniref:alpha/beta fold hydrolase n=1 Tax=Nonomuraea sp. NPDC049784 TaxID=3154361 RepID=UPI00340B12E9
MDTVEVNGLRLAFSTWGAASAPPVILLHSLGESGSAWDVVAPVLAGTHRVYAVDLRGHGSSDRAGEYSFELMRDDVRAALDALELAKVTLIGHSLGAVVSWLLAGEDPERVDRLVLEEPPPPVAANPPRTLPDDPDPDAPFDWNAVAAIYRQRNEPDPTYWDLLKHITAPTLVIAGGQQSRLPQDELARIAELVPDGHMTTIPVGHHVHRDRPEAFIAAVSAFLS